jgi:hypothetical protein
MTHLDEGSLVALRDSDEADAHVTEHLRACARCDDALASARERSAVIAEALAVLDDPIDTSRARAAVRRRLDERRGGGSSSRWWRTHLGRAAAILLVTAGAASALPGSPWRAWWNRADETVTVVPSPGGGAATSQGSPAAAISVPVSEGRMRVIVRGAGPGSVIEVVWVEGSSARVAAPPGSRFTYADGRAEVAVESGAVRVELPRDAAQATLEVDGRTFLERTGARLDVPGPAVERSDAGIRFVVPER